MQNADRDYIILASSSPRRKELLKLTGIPFRVCIPDTDEKACGLPEVQAMEIARRKAAVCTEKDPAHVVLAADTIVYANGCVLGKPQDEADAVRMLTMLSGCEHHVYTGVCVAMGKRNVCLQAYDVTSVTFAQMHQKDIKRYIATQEPFGKAGAYAIQGVGGMYISSVAGSVTNVIGLPLTLVREMLCKIPESQTLLEMDV